jgi:hypothetical protein
MIDGYNIAFKIGDKTICGRTQDDLTIAARTKESLTKDDSGSAQVSVTGHDIPFRASGYIDNTTASGKTTRNEMVVNALKTGSQAVLTFKYMGTGLTGYQGNCVITNYTESSNASDDATWTADFRVTGAMTAIS